jgi:ABC-type transporter MlaC component
MTPNRARIPARRATALALGSLVATFLLFAAAGASHAGDRPASFMKAVGNQLVAAARSGSPYRVANVIRRHSDLPNIGLYSLGNYRKHLPSSRRTSYYDGVARFMARYLLAQSRVYPVTRIDVYTPSRRAEGGHEVDSQVTLRNGSTYTLRWLIVPRRGGFKVRDVSILGMWLTPIWMMPLQRDLFEGYIRDNGGKVTALLTALGS